jgi:hypothetical protein
MLFAFQQRRLISIMTTCFNSVKHKLSHALGYFDLLGFDFMLDSQLNVCIMHTTIVAHVRKQALYRPCRFGWLRWMWTPLCTPTALHLPPSPQLLSKRHLVGNQREKTCSVFIALLNLSGCSYCYWSVWQVSEKQITATPLYAEPFPPNMA